MNYHERAKIGAAARALIQRKSALDGYYSDPNKCQYCGSIIKVGSNQKVTDVRKKKFCNKSHATFYQQSLRPPKPPKLKQPKIDLYSMRTKGELFKKSKNWQSARSGIRKHAERVFKKSGKSFICAVCRYSKHVEICHIKDVADFPGSAKISEINDINNLVTLCPNHHWEFDYGDLVLEVADTGLAPVASTL